MSFLIRTKENEIFFNQMVKTCRKKLLSRFTPKSPTMLAEQVLWQAMKGTFDLQLRSAHYEAINQNNPFIPNAFGIEGCYKITLECH